MPTSRSTTSSFGRWRRQVGEDLDSQTAHDRRRGWRATPTPATAPIPIAVACVFVSKAKMIAARRKAKGKLSDMDMAIAKERDRALEVNQNAGRQASAPPSICTPTIPSVSIGSTSGRDQLQVVSRPYRSSAGSPRPAVRVGEGIGG